MAAVRRRRRALVDFSLDKKKLFDIALTKKTSFYNVSTHLWVFFSLIDYFSALLKVSRENMN